MTDSVEAPERSGRRQDKRERLIAAACQVIYAQGVEKTTLADIAAAAGIPLGNVYYYFKTKDDLLQAVIETRLHEIGAMLAAIEAAHATPRERLKALFGALAEQSALIARHGSERQFQAMGSPDARDLAVEVIARYQGIALLASTFRDPSLMEGEGRRVARWIDALG